jgi:hypothetical protein
VGFWGVALILTADESLDTSPTVFYVVGGLGVGLALGLAVFAGILVWARLLGQFGPVALVILGLAVLTILSLLFSLTGIL